jgi:hypothetical protein
MRFPVSTQPWLPVLLIRRSPIGAKLLGLDRARAEATLASLKAVQRRLDQLPKRMGQHRETVDHPLGTEWGSPLLGEKKAAAGCADMAMHVLACNFTRVMNIVGIIR